MVNVMHGVCVGSWAKFTRYVAPRLGARPVIALTGQTSIARAYNAILDACRGRHLDMLVLQHDDLEILDPERAEATFLDVFRTRPEVAIAGVAGGRGEGSLAWWNSETVGAQVTDSGPLDFGPRTGDVAFVEGSIMAFSPWAIEELQFDEGFPGFHSYDEICAMARALGRVVTVVNVDTHHHTTLGFKSQASADQWAAGDLRFRQKWGFDAA